MKLAQVLGGELFLGTKILLGTQGTFQLLADIGHITRHAIGGSHIDRVGIDNLDIVTVLGNRDALCGTIGSKFRLGGKGLHGIVGNHNDICAGIG